MLTAQFSFLVLISIVVADPQVLWLNKYNNLNTPAAASNLEVGGNLYLASNDDPSLLQKIRITSGNAVYTLNQLTNGKSVRITSTTLTVVSTIEQESSDTLTGYLYVTSAAQANDDTFSVVVVNEKQKLSSTGGNTTTVILNVQFIPQHFPPFDRPAKTTYVTEMEQLSTTDLSFHYDFPGADWKTKTINQFFENPQYQEYYEGVKLYNRTKIFFDHVEPLQINLPYWYITATGPYNMMVESFYNNLHVHNTTAVNTTGLFVLTDVWQDHTVYFTTDPTRQGYYGTLISNFLQYPVSIIFCGSQSSSTQTYGPRENAFVHGQYISNMAPNVLYINATALKPGTLYFQYFVFTGDLLPPTSPQPTTTTVTGAQTTTIATTTKSSMYIGCGFFNLLITCLLFNVFLL